MLVCFSSLTDWSPLVNQKSISFTATTGGVGVGGTGIFSGVQLYIEALKISDKNNFIPALLIFL
jgi:hypothetical protein